VIPGVNEGIEAGDLERTKKQLAVLAQALQKATHVLESYH
jgi:hypothetical protein